MQYRAGRLATATLAPVVPAVEFGTQQPLTDAIRAQALKEVDDQLVAQELIDNPGGNVSKKAQEVFGYTRDTSLPTAGVIVKTAFDDCNICEPEVQKREELEVERLELENKLLEHQIELLDKSQEYRCCPAAEQEEHTEKITTQAALSPGWNSIASGCSPCLAARSSQAWFLSLSYQSR